MDSFIDCMGLRNGLDGPAVYYIGYKVFDRNEVGLSCIEAVLWPCSIESAIWRSVATFHAYFEGGSWRLSLG